MVDARHTALNVLNRLDRQDKTLDRILLELPQGEDFLPRRDRSLLNALVYGVLRWRGRLDHVIRHFSDLPFDRIQPIVLNILRLGLFQVLFLDRIPNSAAVNTAVKLTKRTRNYQATGFVNALLRKAAVNYDQVPFSSFEQDPLSFLTYDRSVPQWLARRWLKRFSTDIIRAQCKAMNTIPPITIRTNSLKTNRKQLIRSLKNSVEHVEPTTYAPEGAKIVSPRHSIPHLTAFQDGWFQVQDEAAQLVSLLLNPKPGESVLDACAGLGGKTAHLAQLMNDRGMITAIDNNPQKLRQLDAEMQRLGVSIVRPACLDWLTSRTENQFTGFDRVLVDAPCSGLGVIRRNPDIKWNASPERLLYLADIQKQLLNNLAASVKSGGILVYTVCSMEPEENEAVIDDFLKNQPDFDIDTDLGSLPAAIRSGIHSVGGFTTLAFSEHMDGFFLVRLKRKK
jgi:16S rRNA (cytosine967-C5)-methyltransferase